MSDVRCGVTAARTNPQYPNARQGHHPLSITESRGVMLRRFELRNTYIHDVTVTSGSSLNVIMDGKGVDLNLDHHRTAPWGNLFTNLHLGCGTRPFASGGKKTRGAYSGILNTYYNLRRDPGLDNKTRVPLPECAFGALLNFVGPFGGPRCPAVKWYIAGLPRTAQPNLYYAQRLARAKKLRAAGR